MFHTATLTAHRGATLVTKSNHTTLGHLCMQSQGVQSLAKSPLPPFVKGGSATRGGFVTADHVDESCVVWFRDELARYEPPEAEGRWRRVKHSLIVDLMHEELDRREIKVTKEEYAIQREGNYLFAALTTNWLETEEFAASIAFRHSNDKSEAMKMYAGVHVFVCDNMCLSGDEIIFIGST